MEKIKVLELFAGIGACSKALKNIGINTEIVDAVEIDEYAIKSFNVIHNTNFDIQNVENWNKNIEVDLISYGSPCQDFSIAGKQAGGDIGSGTRSSKIYEAIRIVGNIKPKYVLWENVKNLLSQKHKHIFDDYIEKMNNLGYNSYYQVLNAKDYGVPQNRERIYTISIRKDIDNKSFKFPEKEELKLRLKDVLEDVVDEKYYLKENQIQNFIKNNEKNCNPSGKGMNGKVYRENVAPTITTNKGEGLKIDVVGMLGIKGNESIRRVYSKEGISPTITDMQGGNRQPKILIKNATKKGYIEANDGDSINLAFPTSNTRRGRVGKQVSQTLQCNDTMGVYDKRIRKLTPKECWRLMGFDDEDFEKAASIPTSNRQLYKQAGNSIVVKVLEKIFINLFMEE